MVYTELSSTNNYFCLILNKNKYFLEKKIIAWTKINKSNKSYKSKHI